MIPKLSHAVEDFVTSAPDGAMQVTGDSGATYWVLTEDAMRIRSLVTEGIRDAEHGNIGPWDTEEIKIKARQLKESGKSNAED